MSKSKQYVIFGGTFDPVHIGHITIMKNVLSLTPYNTIVCMPTSQNPYKPHTDADKNHRLAMLSLGIAHIPHTIISEYEIQKQGYSYTIESIYHIKDRYNITNKIGLVIGSDLLDSLFEWKDIENIAKEATLIIFPRPHYTIHIDDVFKRMFAFQIIEKSIPMDISSKEIRANYPLHKHFLTKEVRHYIETHMLYG